METIQGDDPSPEQERGKQIVEQGLREALTAKSAVDRGVAYIAYGMLCFGVQPRLAAKEVIRQLIGVNPKHNQGAATKKVLHLRSDWTERAKLIRSAYGMLVALYDAAGLDRDHSNAVECARQIHAWWNRSDRVFSLPGSKFLGQNQRLIDGDPNEIVHLGISKPKVLGVWDSDKEGAVPVRIDVAHLIAAHRPPQEIDRNKSLRRAMHRLSSLLDAVAAGQWELDEQTEGELFRLRRQLNEFSNERRKMA